MQRRTIVILITTVLILISIGVVMLASASMVTGSSRDAAYFIKRQLLWLAISFSVAFICTQINLRWIRRMAIPFALFCIALLVIVRIPGIGVNVNGSWRWLRFGPFTLQPSELAKIGIILTTAWWIATQRRYMNTFKRGTLVPVSILGVFAVLLLVEPDFGTTALIAVVTVTMIFAAGSQLIYLLGAGLLGGAAFGFMLWKNPNRMGRILAFLDPEKYAQTEAWQLINGITAFAAGGRYGVGLGNSIQKHHYLPEAHTDFIFPIIGEEFGLPATLIILLLFLVIFICGLCISARASDDFGRFTALGCTLMLTTQAVINIAVVTGSVPTKGLSLPFISYGGSSLMTSFAMIGILVNIAHASRSPKEKKRQALFKDKKRG